MITFSHGESTAQDNLRVGRQAPAKNFNRSFCETGRRPRTSQVTAIEPVSMNRQLLRLEFDAVLPYWHGLVLPGRSDRWNGSSRLPLILLWETSCGMPPISGTDLAFKGRLLVVPCQKWGLGVYTAAAAAHVPGKIARI
jgi:hypothetical protein